MRLDKHIFAKAFIAILLCLFFALNADDAVAKDQFSEEMFLNTNLIKYFKKPVTEDEVQKVILTKPKSMAILEKVKTEPEETKQEEDQKVQIYFKPKGSIIEEATDYKIAEVPKKPLIDFNRVIEPIITPALKIFEGVGNVTVAKKPRYRGRLEEKRLKMYNLNTGDRIDIVFWRNGRYVSSAIKSLNWFFRDYRQGVATKMDKRTITFVHDIAKHFNYKDEIHVISGYRSKKTNDMLRRQGRNVAKKSMHSHGRAIDFNLPGVKLRRIRDYAISKGIGGVGYYSGSKFIHVDTGPKRQW